MTVSPVSSTSASTGAAQPWQQVRNDFQSLSQALAQGDVTAAQKAYASIQQDQQNSPQPPANSPIAQDFSALGQALQNGNLDGAKQAFSSLQTDFQKMRQARGPHGHGGKGAGAGDDDGSSSDTSTDTSTGKTIASQVTTTNANGTLTVTITYTDGSTSSQIQPNPSPTVSQSPLAAGNSGQLAALLTAQEQQALLQPQASAAANGQAANG